MSAGDFIPRTETLTLSGGRVVELSTPVLIWWWDFFFPMVRRNQAAEMSPELNIQARKELAAGQITPDLVSKLPEPILNGVIELTAELVGASREWCLKNMEITDLLMVINSWLKLVNVKDVLGFFDGILQQISIPVLILLTRKAKSMTSPLSSTPSADTTAGNPG
jgi:hypothetical protein